jgi:hypothetical protein
MATPYDDTVDDDNLNFDELMEDMDRLKSGEKMFDANEWLSLSDKFIAIAEDDPSTYVIEPAMEMCHCK